MQTLFLTGSLLLAALLLLDSPQPADAGCCPTWKRGCPSGNDGWIQRNRLCGDCSRPSAFYCGVGNCNVFGCNCDGGCRKPAKHMRSFDDEEEEPVFTAMNILGEGDQDSDGFFTIDEAVRYFFAQGILVSVEEVTELDTNGDGQLSADEIDPQ